MDVAKENAVLSATAITGILKNALQLGEGALEVGKGVAQAGVAATVLTKDTVTLANTAVQLVTDVGNSARKSTEIVDAAQDAAIYAITNSKQMISTSLGVATEGLNLSKETITTLTNKVKSADVLSTEGFTLVTSAMTLMNHFLTNNKETLSNLFGMPITAATTISNSLNSLLSIFLITPTKTITARLEYYYNLFNLNNEYRLKNRQNELEQKKMLEDLKRKDDVLKLEQENEMEKYKRELEKEFTKKQLLSEFEVKSKQNELDKISLLIELSKAIEEKQDIMDKKIKNITETTPNSEAKQKILEITDNNETNIETNNETNIETNIETNDVMKGSGLNDSEVLKLLTTIITEEPEKIADALETREDSEGHTPVDDSNDKLKSGGRRQRKSKLIKKTIKNKNTKKQRKMRKTKKQRKNKKMKK